jgi:hypothetical protein
MSHGYLLELLVKHTSHIKRDFPKRRIIIAIQMNSKITQAAIHPVDHGPAWPFKTQLETDLGTANTR